MKPFFALTNTDLISIKNIVENNSLSFGIKIQCYLYILESTDETLKQRKFLRKKLFDTITTKYPSHNLSKYKQALLKPGTIPHLPFSSISLSHSYNIGGFILSPDIHFSIGLDLEHSLRATKAVTDYIAEELEMKKAPSFSALWSAKEASFKSAYNLNKQLSIKQIIISNWLCIKNNPYKDKHQNKYQYQFHIKDHSLKGQGYIFCLKKLFVSVSFIKNKSGC